MRHGVAFRARMDKLWRERERERAEGVERVAVGVPLSGWGLSLSVKDPDRLSRSKGNLHRLTEIEVASTIGG